MRESTDAWVGRRPVPKGKVVVEVQEAYHLGLLSAEQQQGMGEGGEGELDEGTGQRMPNTLTDHTPGHYVVP